MADDAKHAQAVAAAAAAIVTTPTSTTKLKIDFFQSMNTRENFVYLPHLQYQFIPQIVSPRSPLGS